MAKLARILVPTDFSKHSSQAVQYAEELATNCGSELHLVHAVETLPMLYAEGPYVAPEAEGKMEAAAAKQLNEIELKSADKLPVIRQVVKGHPFVEIVRYAKENHIDLIVIGTHGRGAIAHMLLGSVAEKVVRKAPCSVLVVRGQQHDFLMP